MAQGTAARAPHEVPVAGSVLRAARDFELRPASRRAWARGRLVRGFLRHLRSARDPAAAPRRPASGCRHQHRAGVRLRWPRRRQPFHDHRVPSGARAHGCRAPALRPRNRTAAHRDRGTHDCLHARPAAARRSARVRFRDDRRRGGPPAGAVRIDLGADVEPAVRRMGRAVAERPVHDGHRDIVRAVSLCGHPLVQHGVRPRRDHRGDVDALGRSRAGSRCAPLPGRDAGDGRRCGTRRAARQDPARSARRGNAGARRSAVRALLRQRRRDAACS